MEQKTEGEETKWGQAGSSSGCLKMEEAGTPLQTMSTTFKMKKRKSIIEFDVFVVLFSSFHCPRQ